MSFRLLLILSCVFFPGALFAVSADSQGTTTIRHGRFSCEVRPQPDWVDDLPLPEIKGEPQPGQAVRYLLEDHQVHTGRQVREVYLRSVRELISHQGVPDESEIEIEFNPEYQQLILHQVQVVREGRALDRLADAEIKLLQREQQIPRGIYTGNVSAFIILKDIRAGDLLEYRYTVRGRNPVFGDKVFGSATVGWGVSVGRIRFRLLAPPERDLRTAVHNTLVPLEKHQVGDTVEYLWQQDDTPVVNDEGDYPLWYTPYPWIEYSEYSDWEEVEAWAGQLYPQGRGDSGIVPVAKRLKEESRDEAEYMRRALLFVQEEIRYLGMEIGENSHRPHTPEEVLRRRYGDCKDKARLLVALLREGGIEAYPALVSVDFHGGVKQFLPSPGAFDHVIVMAEHRNRRYWLDGTRNNQRGVLNRLGFIPYGVALVVGRGGPKSLVAVEPLPEQVNRMEVVEHFRADDFEGTVELKVISTSLGNMAEYQRSVFASTSLEEMTNSYLNFYARTYSDIESAGAIEYFDDEEENTFKTVESYRINGFWEADAERYLISSYAVSTIKSFTELPKTLKRAGPLGLGSPVEVHHRIVVDFPEEVELNLPDEPLVYQDQAGYYESSCRYSGRRFVNLAEYRRSRSWIGNEDVDRHLNLLRKIAGDLDFTLTIPYPGKSFAESSYRRLLSRLAEIRKTGKLEGTLP